MPELKDVVSVFDQSLREKGLRVTGPRVKILKLLKLGGEHHSAESLHAALD